MCKYKCLYMNNFVAQLSEFFGSQTCSNITSQINDLKPYLVRSTAAICNTCTLHVEKQLPVNECSLRVKQFQTEKNFYFAQIVYPSYRVFFLPGHHYKIFSIEKMLPHFVNTNVHGLVSLYLSGIILLQKPKVYFAIKDTGHFW